METRKSSNCRRAGLDLGFSAEEKEKLRELAFHAIRSRCLGIAMPEIAVDSPRLKEPGAAFVCIHKGGELRGCIGMIEARAPLWEIIRRMAVEAAFGDPRFCALAADELDEIDIEISVLTPLRRIGDAFGNRNWKTRTPHSQRLCLRPPSAAGCNRTQPGP